tara:strand:- start:7350 stop:8327 length:978 start_codon:yes stop_codon:yes gene_type:complete
MTIAIIGAVNFDCLEFHLHDELTQQGHTVKIFDYKSLLPKKIDLGISLFNRTYVELKNKKLLSKILSFQPELVIGVYRHIHPLVVKGIKSERIKIIHINPDALTTFQNQQLFVEPYDAYFSKDPYIVGFMKDKLNLNSFLYQEAFNPRVHMKPNRDIGDLEKEINIDVLCFGNLYPYRNRMLKQLLDNKIDIKIFGYKTKYFPDYLESSFQNRGIYGEEKTKILNSSRIVFNNFHYAEIESVNNKFFEINGSGAFQISDYKPILNELLPIDPKLVSFKNMDEAVKLIKYYLYEPEERYEIRQIVHSHFLENYSYRNLINHVLNHV